MTSLHEAQTTPPGDPVLIAWAMVHGGFRGFEKLKNGRFKAFVLGFKTMFFDIDPFGLPVLTPELRRHLGDKWQKWKDRQ